MQGTVISIAVLVLSILVIDYFSDFFAALGTTEIAYFWTPNTIPMVFLSVSIFLWFANFHLSYNVVINTIASTTLGVYLLHDGILASWIWGTVFRCAEYQDSPGLVIRILTAAITIFVIGTVLDLLRQTLEKIILKWV